jgi:hypothetical protein
MRASLKARRPDCRRKASDSIARSLSFPGGSGLCIQPGATRGRASFRNRPIPSGVLQRAEPRGPMGINASDRLGSQGAGIPEDFQHREADSGANQTTQGKPSMYPSDKPRLPQALHSGGVNKAEQKRELWRQRIAQQEASGQVLRRALAHRGSLHSTARRITAASLGRCAALIAIRRIAIVLAMSKHSWNARRPRLPGSRR